MSYVIPSHHLGPDQKVRPDPIKLDALRVFKQKFGLAGRLFTAK